MARTAHAPHEAAGDRKPPAVADADDTCLRCNCCCFHFRVSFYHGELDTQPGGTVPAALTVPVSPFRVCMKGTEQGRGGRCVALQADGRCSIYERRSSVCREFPAFLADGSRNPECERLWSLYGITPSAGA